MEKYTRLTEKERCLIQMGIRAGKGLREIGRSIGRPAKTISQEIKRNGGYYRYYAAEAHANRTISNKSGYSKISANQTLSQYIQEKLQIGWSPEVIAGRWNRKNHDLHITHESIYQWVYEQGNNLYLCLPRKKKKRGLKPQRSKSKIPNRTSIHQRPEVINDRSEPGHYESDLVFQQGNKSQNILSVIERKSRMVVLRKNKSKHSAVVIGALQDVQAKNRYPMISVTLDNGSEFTEHEKLGIPTYFCDPGAPYQKGAVENINGIVRRYIDYRINPDLITQEMLDEVSDMINNKPRKILDFLTPNEAMENLYKEKLVGVTF